MILHVEYQGDMVRGTTFIYDNIQGKVRIRIRWRGIVNVLEIVRDVSSVFYTDVFGMEPQWERCF